MKHTSGPFHTPDTSRLTPSLAPPPTYPPFTPPSLPVSSIPSLHCLTSAPFARQPHSYDRQLHSSTTRT
eukprot:4441438-Pleurochrysis_carterae.AAC.1